MKLKFAGSFMRPGNSQYKYQAPDGLFGNEGETGCLDWTSVKRPEVALQSPKIGEILGKEFQAKKQKISLDNPSRHNLAWSLLGRIEIMSQLAPSPEKKNFLPVDVKALCHLVEANIRELKQMAEDLGHWRSQKKIQLQVIRNLGVHDKTLKSAVANFSIKPWSVWEKNLPFTAIRHFPNLTAPSCSTDLPTSPRDFI